MTLTFDATSCGWTIERSSSSNLGGIVVDVNDPVRLYMKLPATAAHEQTCEHMSNMTRFLKDI